MAIAVERDKCRTIYSKYARYFYAFKNVILSTRMSQNNYIVLKKNKKIKNLFILKNHLYIYVFIMQNILFYR